MFMKSEDASATFPVKTITIYLKQKLVRTKHFYLQNNLVAAGPISAKKRRK